jgi:hypothetical protein
MKNAAFNTSVKFSRENKLHMSVVSAANHPRHIMNYMHAFACGDVFVLTNTAVSINT